MNKERRLQRFKEIDLYPVITGACCGGRPPQQVCAEVLAGGARIVQMREKDKSKTALYNLARVFRKLTLSYGALFIVNDHLDLALAAGADGVHLGQEDLPLEAARRIAPELLIGASTHNREEAMLAETAGADYINIGPIFPTATKEGASEALGAEQIMPISQSVQIPYTVMGGIHEENLESVLGWGARKIAMVTGITRAENIAAAVSRIRKRINA
ncbi:thiamine phosphate synthase [candidate division FCPU426 bacterium]|nr:thiamine phosphate synthase [candidate division FCPU426 bacterium]